MSRLRAPSDPHHLHFAQSRALGLKVSDEFTVPLCRDHHRQLHQAGNEVAWGEIQGRRGKRKKEYRPPNASRQAPVTAQLAYDGLAASPRRQHIADSRSNANRIGEISLIAGLQMGVGPTEPDISRRMRIL